MLTKHSAWWGESFVTELRRISETADRKVRFGSVSTARPDTGVDSTKVDNMDAKGDTDGIPTKDKESDPATAVEASKDNSTEAPKPENPSVSSIKAEPARSATI